MTSPGGTTPARVAVRYRPRSPIARYDPIVSTFKPFPDRADGLVPPAPVRQRFRLAAQPPRVVRVVFWITVAQCASFILFQLVRAVTTDWGVYVASRVHTFVHNGRQLEVSAAVVVGTVVFGFVLALVGVAVRLLLARLIVRGYGVARIIFAALAALGVVSTIVDPMPRGVPVIAAVVGGVVALAVGLSAVLLFLPTANGFFRAAKEERLHFRRTRL